jgi:hypothetical protein
VNQEWNERRLIDVSPRKMVAASDVVEFVAEVAVAIIEIDMEKQFGHRDGPDERHATSEKWAVVTGRGGNR